MKNIYPLLIFFISLSISLNAQPPQKISYQAVVRDAQDQIFANKTIGVQITILRNETEVYRERHTSQTNVNGLFSLEIGDGDVTFGNFTIIDWNSGKHFVKTEIDLNGGNNYTLSSITELLSVPYALHAQTAQRLTENPQEIDPIFSASVAKNITQIDIDNWNKKLDIADLENLLTTKVDTIVVVNLDTTIIINKDTIVVLKVDTVVVVHTDTTLLNTIINEIETLKQAIEELQIANGIANGTLVKDIDGNVYKTVKIGNQIWMAENLRVSKWNDGTPINYVQDSVEWRDKHYVNYYTIGSTQYYEWFPPPMYCFRDTSADAKIKHGAFYTWFVIDPTNSKQLCPVGWRVPSINDWEILRDRLIADGYNYDGTTTDNKIGKAMATEDGWQYSDVVGSVGNTDFPEKKNASRFSAIESGIRYRSGRMMHGAGMWWASNPPARGPYSSSPLAGKYARVHHVAVNLFMCPFGYPMEYALSIRCVKN